MSRESMPLKAFLREVEKRLSQFSADELRSILRPMAVAVSPHERRGFLMTLKPTAHGKDLLAQTLRTDQLLLDIDELLPDLQERVESPDEPTEYGYDYHGDEDGESPYEEFVEPIGALFDRIDGAFDSGNRELASSAYERLFTVFDLQDEYGCGLSVHDLPHVDIGKVRARYLRSVYETASPQDRPRMLLDAIEKLRAHSMHLPPQFADAVKISKRKLPDWEEFLETWIGLLRSKEGKDAYALLREAIQMQGGSTSLADFARNEGGAHPRAYLDWVAALSEEGKPKEALAAAEEALSALPRDLPLRAAIADHLCKAAKKLGLPKKLEDGRWEAFAASPELPRLLDLVDDTPADFRPQRLTEAEKHLEAYLAREPRRPFTAKNWEYDPIEAPGFVSSLVLAHAHLLNGNWAAARSLAERQDPLGWGYSGNPQRVVVPAFLILALGQTKSLPRHLAIFWRFALTGDSFASGSSGTNPVAERLQRAYARVFNDHPLTPGDAQSLLAWSAKIAERRVAAIVANQHRSSYGKSAEVVAACAEVYQARGQVADATSLIQRVRDAYPRHRAFQDALNRAIGKSAPR